MDERRASKTLLNRQQGRNRGMDKTGNLFAGKVAFVTGGASGIGRAAALAFARQGASVVVGDVSAEGNQETAHLIEKEGGPALAVWWEGGRGEAVKAALDKTKEVFGRLDSSFNKAGMEARKPA